MEILTVIAAGAVAWLLRASFITFDRVPVISTSFQRLLEHARPAILGALVASAFVAGGGGQLRAIPPGWLLAAPVAILAARRSGNLLVPAVASMLIVAAAAAFGLA